MIHATTYVIVEEHSTLSYLKFSIFLPDQSYPHGTKLSTKNYET